MTGTGPAREDDGEVGHYHAVQPYQAQGCPGWSVELKEASRRIPETSFEGAGHPEDGSRTIRAKHRGEKLKVGAARKPLGKRLVDLALINYNFPQKVMENH